MIELGDERLPPRFWAKVVDAGDCWIWQGGTGGGHQKYGVWFSGERAALVHRNVAKALIRPLHEGEVVHHECRNTLCVNPGHLRLMTTEEHSGHGQRDKTHCPKGHEYTAENTYRKREGWRECRECNRIRCREAARRRRATARERLEVP
jgi:hypothetical protein